MIRSTTAAVAPVSPVVPTPVRPLGLGEVRLREGFWADRQQLNAAAIIPHCLHWEERVGWIANFEAVVDGTVAERRRGREFSDSDVYKLLEAMAWEIGRSGAPELQEQLREIVGKIAACQQADGYLNTNMDNPGQQRRYTDFEWGHELYNFGHLIQAAVARLRTGFDRTDELVQVALKVADHVCDTFGIGGLDRVGGHPGIEVALAELYRATGEPRYLEQARIFVERRGHGRLSDIEFGRAYFQDDVPVREAGAFRGHAVRALYLAAGAIDVGVETGDGELVDTVARQYGRTLARRTYLTGGMGSHHQDESFGSDFQLPPDRAYCETCAGIGSVMLAWRLLLATGDLSYGDVIERTLYNVVAASPAADGRAFFYTNTLHQREPGVSVAAPSPRASGSARAPWFDVSCCPTNVSRTLAQLATYMATVSERGVQLVQFATGDVDARLDDASRVRLRVTTDYPADGRVRIEVIEAPETDWELTIRIPRWAHGATVDLGDGAGPRAATTPAFAAADLRAGVTVQLDLPLAPRWTYPDQRIDAVRGCVAVERGPLVYCAESTDQGEDVATDSLSVDPGGDLLVDGEFVLAAGARAPHDPLEDGWPYVETVDAAAPIRRKIVLRPYHSWGNHGPSTMRVWLPVMAGHEG